MDGMDPNRRPRPLTPTLKGALVPPVPSKHFPRYTKYDPKVPVWCVTPNEGRVFHRFFDTSPISPSGRYLAATRLPAEDRTPEPGDAAQVVLVDLETGEERAVAESRGWDTQLGAQAQWGADDTQLFFNDMDTDAWRPFGVRLDPSTGERRELDGTVYMASPDGRWAASPCLLRTARTQPGYGVVAPLEAVPVNAGAPEDDGLYLTDTETGERRLAASFRRIAEACPEEFDPEAEDYYGFHVKWNPQGDRLQFVVRGMNPDRERTLHARLITLRPDGSGIRVAVPARVWVGGVGNHPNWRPDGENVMMNLNLRGDGMRYVSVRYDGAGLHAMTESVSGRGHPTLHPDERHILTDTYVNEPAAFGDGTVPIRWTDRETHTEECLVRIQSDPPFMGPKKQLRVDPHPAWGPEFRRVVFNGCPDGTRRVYLGDLSALLK